MTDSQLTIRPAVAADAPLILQLTRELADYERLLHEVVATEEIVRASLFGTSPHAEAVIAEWQGEAAGYALFFHNFSTFRMRRGLYLEDLFVRPARRGHGIGRALLQHLAALALQRGCARFEWAVLDWNAPSIQFYQHLGARPLEAWRIFRLDGEALERLAHDEHYR